MKKVLIANRGEIAVRIIRACADYGIGSVSIYADIDRDALHVRQADEAYALEGNTPASTYLDSQKIIAIAQRAGADAVHPGYGFLSESAAFAQAVLDAGLTWIGPSPAAISALGDKVQARRIALQVGAPLVNGTPGPVSSVQEVIDFTQEYGLPIAIKAAFGGGGRGLKVVWNASDIPELYESAVREAVTAFGRGECFVEQFLDKPRHVEAQFMADQHGQVVVLGTRDCSLQRRNQKLVEEAPAPFLSEEQLTRIVDATKAIALAANYQGVGTAEYLLSRSGALSFLEVNTRLQVEHTVTEEVSGIDLVIEQFRIAQGLPLSVSRMPAPRGHAFEFRINAEDVGRGFLPCPGDITRFDIPMGPGVRLDTGVLAGSTVAGMFDSLMAKLIVTGATRQQAIARARRALREFKIEGVASVLPFHQAVMQHPDFTNVDSLADFKVHTRWIETDFANTLEAAVRPDPVSVTPLERMDIEIDGRRVRVGLPKNLLSLLGVVANAGHELSGIHRQEKEEEPSAPANRLLAPMAGSLHVWRVTDGQTVQEGDVIAVMEAMKMETQLLAPCSGKVQHLVQQGEYLSVGTPIAQID